MKKIFLSMIVLLFLSASGFARAPYTEFKVGYLYPEDTKSGYIFGVNLGRMIDESLSWSFEFNYFQKGYKRITTDYEINLPSGISPTGKKLDLEYKTRILPLFVKLNYEHPIAYKSPIYLRAAAGLGWEFLWNTEDNYLSDTHKTRFFHGFGWQLGAGLGIEISSSANFFVDAMYNGSKVKRNESKDEEGYRTWEELDISGFGVRVGVSIVGFGW